MLTDEQINEIEARCTNRYLPAGPWVIDREAWIRAPRHRCPAEDHNDCAVQVVIWPNGYGHSAEQVRAVAEFSAHAREDVPALLAEVRRLTDTLYAALQDQEVTAEYQAWRDAELAKGRDYRDTDGLAYAREVIVAPALGQVMVGSFWLAKETYDQVMAEEVGQ